MDDEIRSRASEDGRPLAALSDDDLLRRLTRLLAQSRRVESDLVAHIAEVDARRLFAHRAFPSMFAYCTDALHLSESEAYLRITAAWAPREHPMILPMLGDGRLHLSAVVLLSPHLTGENRETLLQRAMHRSKRQIEELVAELFPRADAPALMRRLPGPRNTPAPTLGTPSRMGRIVTPSLPMRAIEPTAIGPVAPPHPAPPHAVPLANGPRPEQPQPVPSRPSPPAVLHPLAPGRYKVQFTASAELHWKLERLRGLMRAQVPDGDLAAIIEAAVSEKLARMEARQFGATSRPRKALPQADTSPASRHIPAPVRRAVRERDGGQCRFVSLGGRRCEERDRLEYHHRRPFGVGGDHRPANLSLMCRAHNALLAEHDYGRAAASRFRRPTGRVAGTSAPASHAAQASRARAAPPGP
jgi:hypothetical protein